ANAQDLLDGEPVWRRGPSKAEMAETLLLDLLSDGPKAQKFIEEAATDTGIPRTPLYDAKKRLGVQSEEIPDGFGQKVLVWSLSGGSPKSQIPAGTGTGTVPVPNPNPDGTGPATFGAQGGPRSPMTPSQGGSDEEA